MRICAYFVSFIAITIFSVVSVSTASGYDYEITVHNKCPVDIYIKAFRNRKVRGIGSCDKATIKAGKSAILKCSWKKDKGIWLGEQGIPAHYDFLKKPFGSGKHTLVIDDRDKCYDANSTLMDDYERCGPDFDCSKSPEGTQKWL